MKFEIALLLCTFLFSCHDSTNSSSKNLTTDTLPTPMKNIDSSLALHVYPDAIDEENILKAEIFRRDSSFLVIGNIRKDYRIFGYQRPDTNSKRLILFSVFTRDVENNPYKCKYGTFYETSSMKNSKIKYKAVVDSFVAAELYIEDRKAAELFFEKKWIEFVD